VKLYDCSRSTAVTSSLCRKGPTKLCLLLMVASFCLLCRGAG
jgi:hypothetical protein